MRTFEANQNAGFDGETVAQENSSYGSATSG
jgi:hypothetical protein